MSELREEELDQLFQQAVSLHPAEDKLGLFHDGATDEVTSAQIKAHLRRCLDCRERFDTMQHILATYHEVEVPPENVARLKALIAATSPRQAALMHALMQLMAAIIGAVLVSRVRRLRLRAAGEPEIQRGQTANGELQWQSVESESGDLIVSLSSHRLELENAKLILSIGPLPPKEITLEREAKDELGAQLRITATEREQLPDNVELIVADIVLPETNQGL